MTFGIRWAVITAWSLCMVPCALAALSLDDAFLLALQKNERIEISEEDVLIAENNIRMAKSVVLPDVSVSFAQSLNRKSGTGGFSTFRHNGELRLDVQQPLYGGGKAGAVYRGATIGKEISEWQVNLVKQSILFAVATEYFSLLRAQEKLTIAHRARQLARDQLALARARKEAGTATRTDVIRSEVAVSAAERDLVQSENAVSVYRARLGFAIGRKVAEPVADAGHANLPVAKPENTESYIEQAFHSRCDYKIGELAVKIADEKVRAAHAAFRPSANLSGNYSVTERVNAVRDPQNWQVQAKIEYDIFEGFGRNAAYETAKSHLRQATLEQARLAREIELDVHESVLEIGALTAIREALKKEVASARENYERVIAQFRESLSTAVDVADAHTAQIAAEVQLAAAETDIRLANKKLELSMGTLGEKYLKGETK